MAGVQGAGVADLKVERSGDAFVLTVGPGGRLPTPRLELDQVQRIREGWHRELKGVLPQTAKVILKVRAPHGSDLAEVIAGVNQVLDGQQLMPPYLLMSDAQIVRVEAWRQHRYTD